MLCGSFLLPTALQSRKKAVFFIRYFSQGGNHGYPPEIQSAQPVRIGISVSLVPDYLPGLETQLDKFRQQYPHVEMRFRMMDNDAVADDVEQGELDAGLVIDLGCAAPVLARTTLRADPACLLVPRGHAFWDKESIPLAELRGQRVLLPSLRQDLFSPLWSACARTWTGELEDAGSSHTTTASLGPPVWKCIPAWGNAGGTYPAGFQPRGSGTSDTLMPMRNGLRRLDLGPQWMPASAGTVHTGATGAAGSYAVGKE